MIELTKEEATQILIALSMFEGYLFSVKDNGSCLIADQLEYPVQLLSAKLSETK